MNFKKTIVFFLAISSLLLMLASCRHEIKQDDPLPDSPKDEVGYTTAKAVFIDYIEALYSGDADKLIGTMSLYAKNLRATELGCSIEELSTNILNAYNANDVSGYEKINYSKLYGVTVYYYVSLDPETDEDEESDTSERIKHHEILSGIYNEICTPEGELQQFYHLVGKIMYNNGDEEITEYVEADVVQINDRYYIFKEKSYKDWNAWN